MPRNAATRPAFDAAPWIVLPAVILALSGVSLLSFRTPAHGEAPVHQTQFAFVKATPAATALSQAAAQPEPASAAPPAAEAVGDGDGDELLEHWGDPKYGHEERVQLAGLAAFLAGAAALRWRNGARTRRHGNA